MNRLFLDTDVWLRKSCPYPYPRLPGRGCYDDHSEHEWVCNICHYHRFNDADTCTIFWMEETGTIYD